MILKSPRILSSALHFAVLFSGLLMLNGCAALGGAAILTAGVGNATAIGIERSFDGAIIKTVTEDAETVLAAVHDAMDTMGFNDRKSTRGSGVATVWAKSPKRDVRVKLTTVAENATRIRIDVDEGWVFTEDPATAGEIMIQTELALRKQR